MRKRLRLLYSTPILFLSSCTTIATHFPGVYAIDVEQGNIIDQEMINQLRPNMNKRQVLYIMGSPMLTDAVHPERWDYIYSQQPGGEERVQKRISLYFKKDRLVAVKGDFRPSSIPAMPASNEEIVEVPKRVLEKTLFEKIAALFVSDDTAVPANKTRIPENIDKPEKTIDKLKSEPAPEILNQDINTPATPPSELQTPESGIPSTQVPQSSPTDTGMNPEN